jgi:phosphate starvation-inducible PhoH-like protein
MPDSDKILVHGIGGKLIKAMTPNQQKLVELCSKKRYGFCCWSSRNRKNLYRCCFSSKSIKRKTSQTNILTRPAVEAGENLGFLPGDMKEKLDPYMQPLYDALRDMLPPQTLEDYILKGIIQIAPLAFMRGRTLDNAFVILDEAQNTTHSSNENVLNTYG